MDDDKFRRRTRWKPVKPLKFVERIYESGYMPVATNVGFSSIALAAGILAMLGGSPWWAGIDFFCAGIAVGCTVAVITLPLRVRKLNDLQRAAMEREAQKIIETVVADATRRGMLPPDTNVGGFRVN